jgi:hypothetical protein
VVDLKLLGVGLTLAMVIDATVVRGIGSSEPQAERLRRDPVRLRSH